MNKETFQIGRELNLVEGNIHAAEYTHPPIYNSHTKLMLHSFVCWKKETTPVDHTVDKLIAAWLKNIYNSTQAKSPSANHLRYLIHLFFQKQSS